MIAELVRLSAIYLVVYIYIRHTWSKTVAMMVQWLAVVSLGLMVLSVVAPPLSQLNDDIHLIANGYSQGRESIGKGLFGIFKDHWQSPMKGEITQQFDGVNHHGIDIASPLGTPIEAIGEGKVTSISWSSAYGNFIIINHGKGIESLYGHLSGWNVKVGSPVTPGKQIGVCGSSGNSTGPHLHFEIRLNGKTVDPAQYFK